MSARTWRAILIVVGVAVAALDLWGFSLWQRTLVPSASGTLGAQLGARAPDFSLAVVSVEAGGPLAAAGVKAGDRVRFERLGDARRAMGVDEPIRMQVESGGTWRAVEARTAAARPDSIGAADWIAYWLRAGYVVIALAVGLLVGWRQADNTAARLFALCLLTASPNFFIFALPAGGFQDFLSRISQALYFYPAYILFVAFAFLFPEGRLTGRRRRVRYALYAYLALGIGQAALSVAHWLGKPLFGITVSPGA
jgi:hypothetical protein